MEKKFKIKPVAGTMFVTADETITSGIIIPNKKYNETEGFRRIIEGFTWTYKLK